ncbi:MAG TPA: HAD family phosphatase [Anaerolineae bacterium]|nr:HAD family phosphatase [Anaerolineae bacterium]
MIRALLTDFGGVLVRSRTDRTRRALEARLGLPSHSLENLVFGCEASLRGQRGDISHEDCWKQIGLNLKLGSRMTVAEFYEQFFVEDFLDEELLALIRSMRPAIKTGLISNAWDNGRHLFTAIFPIADAFDVMVISAEERVTKPDPRIYQAALARLGVQAVEAVFVDDMPENVRGAEALGIHGIHFQSSEQAQREIRQLLALPDRKPGF